MSSSDYFSLFYGTMLCMNEKTTRVVFVLLTNENNYGNRRIVLIRLHVERITDEGQTEKQKLSKLNQFGVKSNPNVTQIVFKSNRFLYCVKIHDKNYVPHSRSFVRGRGGNFFSHLSR